MKNKEKKTLVAIAIGAAAIVLCLCIAFGGVIALINATPSPVAEAVQPTVPPAAATVPADTAVPTIPASTSTPEATPTPEVTLEPRQALKIKIEETLREGNRDIPRLTAVNFDDPEPGALFVNWAINDNLTDGLIIFGAKKDATDILKAIAESGLDYTYVLLSGSFSMVDAYGKTEEKNVVNLTFYKPTVDRIVWENFLSDNIYLIADEAFIFNALQGDWKPSPMP